MAGKSGRSINNVPENPMKHIIFSWEGILVILFILVNIFCASFSEFYNMKSVLRQMPVYLAEVFMMFPMAYILVLGEIDISVGAIVCLSATLQHWLLVPSVVRLTDLSLPVSRSCLQ